MQFITNRIRTGKAKSFADLVKELSQPKQETVKTASVQEPVKVAEEKKEKSKDEAPSSGQLDVEPLHQTGESTEMPKKGPSAKKDDNSAKAAATKTNTEEEGKDSGQPKAEGSEKFTNDPKKPDKKDAAGTAKVEVKEAGKVCEKCGKICGDKEEGCACDESKACSGSADTKVKKAGKLPEALKEHMFKKKDEKGEEKSDGDGEIKEEDKKAEIKKQFVKVANLDGKNKAFLRKFWRQLYGEEYVNALLADK